MSKFLLVIILLFHSFILTKLIFFPYPELFIYPYLTNHGLKPYSQILDQHFPGLMFLPINFNNLGMTTADLARIWLIGIVLSTHILIFIVSKNILKDEKKALLVNILYLIWQPFFEGWVLWIDSFLALLLLPAFLSFYKRWFFTTGLLLGVGVVFKQTLIPLVALALIYIFWQDRKLENLFRSLLGVLLPVILMVAYLASIGVIKDFWYWSIVFNLTTFAQSGTKAPASLGFIIRAVFVYIASLLFLFNQDKKLVKILALFIIGSMVGILDRADFIHFQPSLPFIMITTVVGFSAIWNKRITKLILLGYMIVGVWWLGIFYKGHLSNKILFFDDQTKAIAAKIRDFTIPGEKIFIFGSVPHLYQMSNTLPAGDIFVFQFPWFLKVAENRLLEGIEKDKPRIIISDRSVEIEGQKIIDFAKNIDVYIQQNYQQIDRVGSADILIRKR